MAPVALTLGYLGYRSAPGIDLTRSDALYKSLQLFVLDAALLPQGTPWELNVARFLAPATVVYAAVLTVMAILREQVTRLGLALFARKHVVLVGLGSTNAALAQSLARAGWRVAVVETDSLHERINGVRASGIRVVPGDARQDAILRRAQVGRAKHVIISTGEDSQNLEVAEQVRRLSAKGSQQQVVHVAVRDQALWNELGRLQLSRGRSGVVFEFYNLMDRAAQQLLDEVERLSELNFCRDLVIEGDGILAVRTLIHVVRRAVLAGVRPRIRLTPRASGILMPVLRERHPWVTDAADLLVAENDEAELRRATLTLVCITESDSTAIARAVGLAERMPHHAVVTFVQGQHSDALLHGVGAPAGVHLVPAAATLAKDFLAHSGVELMARGRHEEYLTQERGRGVSRDQNPSAVPWHELPESLKESNRRFAEGVGDVISSLGGTLTPLRRLEPGDAFLGHDGVLEQLARNEHDRWMAALHQDGWVQAEAPKNPERKTHPLLVPWSELPEDEREKDRDAIRAIPRMLARVGYAVDLPTPHA